MAVDRRTVLRAAAATAAVGLAQACGHRPAVPGSAPRPTPGGSRAAGTGALRQRRGVPELPRPGTCQLATSYYGVNYQELVQINGRYDQEWLLRFPQGIPPR